MLKEQRSDAQLPAYLSTGQAASILRVSITAVRDLVVRGRLPGMQVGRNWIIPRDALLEFAETYVKGPGRRKSKSQQGAKA